MLFTMAGDANGQSGVYEIALNPRERRHLSPNLEENAMRYLVLAADFLSPQVRDQSGSDDHDPWADLSPELRAALLEWNQQYQVVVPTAIDDRQGIQALIRALDERGVDLASRVADELRPAKVKYYSEGQLTYLVEV